MTPVLEAKNLSKSFDGLKALQSVSFEVQRGEILALIGPNGAGKTTCFNVLNGYIKPDQGVVHFEGQKISGKKPRQIWRMGVGRTFQITRSFLSMSVIENVQMAFMSNHNQLLNIFRRATLQYRAEAEAVLERVAMLEYADHPCSELAYGDLKRLDLAIGLAHQPRLLLMDEPTAGMAPAERRALMQLIDDIVQTEAISVLFTEHDMDVVFDHAHRILVLNRGSLIAEGTSHEIRNNELVKEVYLGGGTVFENLQRSVNA